MGRECEPAELPVFVYGILRRGAGAHPELLRAGARFLGPATLRGRLYGLGQYPGAVRSENRGDLVVGELWTVSAAGLERLDGYEGCELAAPAASLFVRAVLEVETPSGARRAWGWLWSGPADARARIRGGDWLEALPGDP